MVIGIAQRLFHRADVLDHIGKFLRFHGEGAVRAAVCTAQGQVLLNHPGAEGSGGGGHCASHGMVGQAGETAEGTAQGGHHIQVNVLIGSGISGDAFHQKHIFVSFLFADRKGPLDVRKIRHARRQNHGLMEAGDPADEGKIGDLIGGHLVGGHIHGSHEVHRCGVKGGGKALQSQTVRLLHQLRLPVPWSVGFLIQLMKRGAVPYGSFVDLKIRGIAVQGDGVGSIGLQLDGVRSGLLRGMDDFDGPMVVLQVVGRHFRHDENGAVFPYPAGTDGKLLIHEACLLPCNFSA